MDVEFIFRLWFGYRLVFPNSSQTPIVFLRFYIQRSIVKLNELNIYPK